MKMKSIRFGLVLLAGGSLSAAAPALAQSLPYGAGQYREDPGEALSRNLKALADSPRSLTALMGAGKAALELGDPQAAVTFFARAEEIAPRDGRIKAGFGSAFLMMEQPGPAMRFFNEASGLGVPDVEFARDRGLAYDLLGDPKRAQADYATALRRGEDPEVRRRLALSLANSGDRNGALAAIDAQLRQQDRAAWRTRAFVLALTGDTAQAAQTMQSVMPGQVAAMQPFFARLPSLNPSERAMAVHYGHFPADARPVQMAQAPTSSYAAPRVFTPTPTPTPTPAPVVTPRVTAPVTSSTVAGRPDAGQSALGRPRAPAPAAVERRVGRSFYEDRADSRIRNVRRATPATPAPQNPPVQTNQVALAQAQVPRTLPVQVRPALPAQQPGAGALSPTPGFAGVGGNRPLASIPTQSGAAPTPSTSVGSTQQFATTAPSQVQGPAGPTGGTLPGPTGGTASVAQVQARVTSNPSVTSSPPAVAQSSPQAVGAPAPTAPKPAQSGLAAVAAAVNALSDPAPSKPAPAPAASPKPVQTDARPLAKAAPKPTEAKLAADKKADPVKAEAGRYWVQIASAPDRLVESEFKRLKAKAPKLLSDKSGWSAPLGASNRVLVGPFKSASEAQDMVNQLAKADLTAFSWTSPAGQEMAKLAAK